VMSEAFTAAFGFPVRNGSTKIIFLSAIISNPECPNHRMLAIPAPAKVIKRQSL